MPHLIIHSAQSEVLYKIAEILQKNEDLQLNFDTGNQSHEQVVEDFGLYQTNTEQSFIAENHHNLLIQDALSRECLSIVSDKQSLQEHETISNPINQEFILHLHNLEESLRVSQHARNCQEDLFKYNPFPLFEMTLSGRFIKVNDATCRLTCFEEQELIGLPLFSIVREQDEELVKRSLRKILDGNLESFKLVVRVNDTIEKEIEFSLAPIYRNNKVFSISGVMRELSEIKTCQIQTA